MLTRHDVLRLSRRPAGEHPVLSVFLDTSVNEVNQRTYRLFLDKERAKHSELDSDRAGHHREALGEAFERIETWLAESFDESNKGVALYTEIGGEWLDALQFPVPVRNRIVISNRPVIGPLAQIVEENPSHGVIVVDRERLRMLYVVLGQPLAEHDVTTDPYPTPHDVKAGGEAAKDLQKRKAEETRHFFKAFALEVAEFDRRYRPDDLILLGTEENVSTFHEFLPHHLQDKVVHTEPAPPNPAASEVLARLHPFFAAQREQNEEQTVRVLRERVAQGHLTAAGIQGTLEQLQEAKVDTLLLARDGHLLGSACIRCGFLQAREDAACPYCGGRLEHGIDLAEAMIRLAVEQDAAISFVAPETLADLDGTGALLKF